MQYRTLGNTDIRVSQIALGCWQLISDTTWGAQGKADSLAAIQTALDCGINFFDTAPGYGNGESERLLGEAFAGIRDQVVLATKVPAGQLGASSVRRCCEESLQRLRTEYIDLYQVHWSSREVPIAETIGALQSLQDEGKIRAYGVSNFGIQDLAEALHTGVCVTNQMPYSLLTRAVEFEILPACREAGVSLLCYSPLAQGLLTGKFLSPEDVPEGRARTRHFSCNRPQTRHGESGCENETFQTIRTIADICRKQNLDMDQVALAWLLEQSGVASVLAGARNAAQVRRNASASDLQLSPDMLRDLDLATSLVKQLLGPNADLWQGSHDSRIR